MFYVWKTGCIVGIITAIFSNPLVCSPPDRTEALHKLLSQDLIPQVKLMNVVLRTSEKDILLENILGGFSASHSLIAFYFFLDFQGARAPVRIKETQPSVILTFRGPIRGRIFLVKTERDYSNNTRSLKMGTGGFASITDISAPDHSCLVQVTQKEMEPGIWILTPQNPLEPGEYGVFQRGEKIPPELFDFDVIGPHKFKEATNPQEYAEAQAAAKADSE